MHAQGSNPGEWQRPQPPRRSFPIYSVIAIGLLLVVAALGIMFFVSSGGDEENVSPENDELDASTESAEKAGEVLDVLIAGLEADDLSAVPFTAGTAATAISDYRWATEGLAPFSLAVDRTEVQLLGDSQASAGLELQWTFDDVFQWSTSSFVSLERVVDEWQVVWSGSVLSDDMADGDQLVRRDLRADRGSIVDRNQVQLVGSVDVVDIGIQPSRVEDLATLTATLGEVLGVDAAELSARVQAASPNAFVDVISLRREAYDVVRPVVFPLPGTVFRESSVQMQVENQFARALLGRSGEVTAEIMENNPGVFEVGDIVGRSGMQFTYNLEMVGTDGMAIDILRAQQEPEPGPPGSGLTTTSSLLTRSLEPEPEEIFVIPAEHGTIITTTLDADIQRAAEQALEATTLTSALVAVQVSTGDILAVANGPRGATSNFALVGRYPPGSTFKVVTAYSLLRDHITTESITPCPATITVNGRSFANAENEAFGNITFRDAFVHSCNTSFVGATMGFDETELNEVAAEFGFGVNYDLGVDAFTGDAPVNEGPVDMAASSFGQGRVLASPLTAAVMAATAGDGVYRTPQLVTNPPPATPRETISLEPNAAAALRELMRAVVTEGTGRAVSGVAGGPVAGKTGTAEFGNSNPPQSHAWFVGYQGDVAFAVFVEAGEFGGSTAAPIAGQFLNLLASGSLIEPVADAPEAPATPDPEPPEQPEGEVEDENDEEGN